ncbi:L,D-transpeptidase family protein [Algihabitans albus]|uniref:L,D-transpeptidase family protein n=1 Tax=Algihabitans albus TaxID=2164067 RepID=UPI000E5D2BB1|nr:L,D-transpeptidase family protein [Algihabitans albus]
MDLIVEQDHRDAPWTARWGAERFRCAIGRSGAISALAKREGDGATPRGAWPLERLFWRPDRGLRPETAVPAQPITISDGWCDAPLDTAYNRLVQRPFASSHETLWRKDELYDLLVVLSYNRSPILPFAGSAIFLHCAKRNYPPTAGCVALARPDLEKVLAQARLGDRVVVVG